jgi:hypothetical protein
MRRAHLTGTIQKRGKSGKIGNPPFQTCFRWRNRASRERNFLRQLRNFPSRWRNRPSRWRNFLRQLRNSPSR